MPVFPIFVEEISLPPPPSGFAVSANTFTMQFINLAVMLVFLFIVQGTREMI